MKKEQGNGKYDTRDMKNERERADRTPTNDGEEKERGGGRNPEYKGEFLDPREEGEKKRGEE